MNAYRMTDGESSQKNAVAKAIEMFEKSGGTIKYQVSKRRKRHSRQRFWQVYTQGDIKDKR